MYDILSTILLVGISFYAGRRYERFMIRIEEKVKKYRREYNGY